MPGYKNSTRRKSSRRGSSSRSLKSTNQGPSNPPPTRNYNAVSEDYKRSNFVEKFKKIVTNESAPGASPRVLESFHNEKKVNKQRLGEKHEETAAASSRVFQEKLVYKQRNGQDGTRALYEGFDGQTSYYDEENWVNRRRSSHHTGNVTSLSQGFSYLSVRSTHTLRSKSSERSSTRTNYDSAFEKLAIKPRLGDKHHEKIVTYEATAGASAWAVQEKLVLKPRNGQDGIGALYEGSDGKFKYYDGTNWVNSRRSPSRNNYDSNSD